MCFFLPALLQEVSWCYLGADRRRRSGFSLVERDSAEPQPSCEERNREGSERASSFLYLHAPTRGRSVRVNITILTLSNKTEVISIPSLWGRIRQEGEHTPTQHPSSFSYNSHNKTIQCPERGVTYRNCAPWEKPIALYPPFNLGSWASWPHTSDTCSFTSMKNPFSVSCREDRHEKFKPWQTD